MSWIKIIADTINASAALAIAFVVLSVHNKIKEQTEIDPVVLAQMTTEETIVIIAIVLIGVAYALNMMDQIGSIYKETHEYQLHEKMVHGKVSPDIFEKLQSKMSSTKSRYKTK